MGLTAFATAVYRLGAHQLRRLYRWAYVYLSWLDACLARPCLPADVVGRGQKYPCVARVTAVHMTCQLGCQQVRKRIMVQRTQRRRLKVGVMTSALVNLYVRDFLRSVQFRRKIGRSLFRLVLSPGHTVANLPPTPFRHRKERSSLVVFFCPFNPSFATRFTGKLT